MLEMVVVSPNGSIFRGKVDYDFQAGELLAIVPKANDVFNGLNRMIRPPNISMNNPELLVHAARLPTVFISQRFSELGIVEYEPSFSTSDAMAIADLQHEPIKKMWSAYLRRTWP